MAKIKLSDYIFNYLRHCGVTKVFGVPGGGCMHLYNSAHITPGLTLVPSFHEQASALATQSYAEVKNELGVCLVTAGPGLSNAVTGISACWIESTPALFIGGQAKTADAAEQFGVRSLGQQELNGVAIVTPITKKAVRLTVAEDIHHLLPELVATALSGRKGPVFLEVPLDMQASLVEQPDSFAPLNLAAPAAGPAQVDAIAALVQQLATSRKPAILIGAGVRTSACGPALIALCERNDIAVLLTWKTLQLLPEDHRLNFGRPGGICQPYANDILQDCDLFISLGARNDLVSVAFDYTAYAMSAEHRVFVDIDPNELRKYSLAKDSCIALDAAVFTAELAAQLDKAALPVPARADWLAWCAKTKADKHILSYHPPKDEYVSTYKLVDMLSDRIDETHTIIPGSSGSCSDIFMQAFRVKGDTKIQNAPGLGAMGTCLAAISGAYLAFEGSRKVVSIVGDGGFQFNLQELQTIKNLDVNVSIFVLNNNGYASIRRSQTNHFGNNIHTDKNSGIVLSSLSSMATAFGFDYVALKHNDQIADTVAAVLSKKGQILIEVFVDPDEDVRPRVGARLEGNKIFSANMREYK